MIPQVEVEYLKGGKRRKMGAHFAKILVSMKLAKMVDAVEPEKKKRAYKRRDMQAEGIVDKTV